MKLKNTIYKKLSDYNKIKSLTQNKLKVILLLFFGIIFFFFGGITVMYIFSQTYPVDHIMVKLWSPIIALFTSCFGLFLMLAAEYHWPAPLECVHE